MLMKQQPFLSIFREVFILNCMDFKNLYKYW